MDCRFDLANPAWGEKQYLAGHIPGAIYAHLDRDLSGTKTGTNGRHPLPTLEEMMRALRARWGSTRKRKWWSTIADSGMHASRLWWMLRFIGHDAVALLDGGWARWTREGGALNPGPSPRQPAMFTGRARAEWRLTVDEVQRGLGEPARLLVDARSGERFRGEGETLDQGGRPHSRRRQRVLPEQPEPRQDLQAARGAARAVVGDARRARPRRTSSATAAPASPPATTCWRWKWRGWAARASSRARGASGAPTRRARWSVD